MRRHINFPLLSGLVLVAFIIVLAIWGPAWAPHNPLERTTLLQIDGEWDTAPFAPGTPGFPLGSDQAGRDVLSRLLWAVRPTLLLVVAAVGVRLLVGISVGLLSTGSSHRLSWLLELLTAAFLAVPALLIALALLTKVILLSNSKPSRLAFIIALSIAGWAESARMVREQTRLLLAQPYVEAARALGASQFSLYRRHILPHLMPMIWMQSAFEVGAAIMLVGGLGFLGIFMGGSVTVNDSLIHSPLAAYPDLGEMLSSSIQVIVEPWGMVFAGTVVFFTVLGFNLIGQGLRIAQSLFAKR